MKEGVSMQEKKLDMEQALSQNFVTDLAEFFRVFGDATRIRLLWLLVQREMNVGQLAEALDMTQSAVSHQLRVLRQNDLVKYRKDGKTVYYSLDDDHVKTVLQNGTTHICHKRGYM